jgi:threonine dehydrogenase-like Zn-dependent dehydrogenase
MRTLIFDGKGLNLSRDLPLPKPDAGEVLLKLKGAGICNTDLELMKGYMNFSGILGHEFVGTVEQGPESWMWQRVVGEINVACGRCDMCLHDVPSQCRDRSTVGIDRYNGAFADYMRLPIANLHPVPDSVSDDAAVFVEPLAAALQILEAVHISPRDRVVVIGAGKLGMLVAQVLKLTGADLSVIVRREKQAKMLNDWHIRPVERGDLPPHQAQIVVDCTGQADGFADALELVEPRGTIVLKSTYEGFPQADLTQVAVNEIKIVGSRCGPFEAALRLLAAGLIDVSPLIDSRYRLDDALEAMTHAAQKGVLKVLLDI